MKVRKPTPEELEAEVARLKEVNENLWRITRASEVALRDAGLNPYHGREKTPPSADTPQRKSLTLRSSFVWDEKTVLSGLICGTSGLVWHHVGDPGVIRNFLRRSLKGQIKGEIEFTTFLWGGGS